jgi:hypothetical protein
MANYTKHVKFRPEIAAMHGAILSDPIGFYRPR